MRNNLCKNYSNCYSALQIWRATVANLKKKLEMPRLLDFILGVNSGFFLQNLEMPSPVGDALIFQNLDHSDCNLAPAHNESPDPIFLVETNTTSTL